jgi:hypothetical protein
MSGVQLSMNDLILPLLIALVSCGLYNAARRVLGPFFSPLRNLPGPSNPSFLFGHFKEMTMADLAVAQERWVEKYGSTIVYKGFMNVSYIVFLHTERETLTHLLIP